MCTQINMTLVLCNIKAQPQVTPESNICKEKPK